MLRRCAESAQPGEEAGCGIGGEHLPGSSQCTAGSCPQPSKRVVSNTTRCCWVCLVRMVRNLFRGQVGCRRDGGGLPGGMKASGMKASVTPRKPARRLSLDLGGGGQRRGGDGGGGGGGGGGGEDEVMGKV